MDMNAPSVFEGTVRGRRIFDLNYLIHQVKKASNHGKNNCGWIDVDLVREVQDGLRSSFEFKCRECQLIFNLKTDDDQQKDFNLDVLWSAAGENIEFSSLDAILKAADIPSMPSSSYETLKPRIDGSGPKRIGEWPIKKTSQLEPQKYPTLTDGPNSATGGCVDSRGRNMDSDTNSSETHSCNSNRQRAKNRYAYSVRCLYCGKVILHRSLLIHFVRKHKDKEEIKNILNLQKNHPRRAILLRNMKRKCDKTFNGPTWKKQDPNYLPCVNCKNLYRYDHFNRHYIDCSRVSGKHVKISAVLKMGQEQETENIKDFKIKIVLGIKTEVVRDFIIGDPILTEYGIYSMNQEQKRGLAKFSCVRNSLYVVVAVFFIMQEKNPEMSNILDVFDTKLWGTFIEAIHEYTKVQSTLRKLRLQFYKISRFAAAHCKRLEINTDLLHKWIPLFRNNHVQVIRRSQKWGNLSWFAVTERLAVLFKFAHDELRRSLDSLKNKGFDSETFETLNYAAMLKIMSYNRNRVLDLEKLLISDFEKRQTVTRNTDVWKCLDESEKFTAERCKYFEIRHKFCRSIAVLLDSTLVDAVEMILVLREKNGVSSRNPYVFGDGDSFYTINSAIDKLASRSGVEASCTASVITSADLKKYVACMSHALSMNNFDVEVLKRVLESSGGDSENTDSLTSNGVMLRLAKLFRLLVALNEEGVDDLKKINMSDIDVDVEVGSSETLGRPFVREHVPEASDAVQATGIGVVNIRSLQDVQRPASRASLLPPQNTPYKTPAHAPTPADPCAPVIDAVFSLASDLTPSYSHATNKNSMVNSIDSSTNYSLHKQYYSPNCSETPSQAQHPLTSTMPYTNEVPYYSSYETEMQRNCVEFFGFQPGIHNRWPLQNFSSDTTPSKFHAGSSKYKMTDEPHHFMLKTHQQRPPRSKSPSSKIKRISWTADEKQSLLEFFGPDIFIDQKLPSYYACEKAIAEYGCLHLRTKAQVKAFINNEQRKWKKRHGQPPPESSQPAHFILESAR